MALEKIEVGGEYKFGGWGIKILSIDEASSPEFIQQQSVAAKPKKTWLFRRAWYSKDGDSGDPFWVNEAYILMLASKYCLSLE